MRSPAVTANSPARGCGRLRRYLFPEILKPRRRQFGIAHCVLYRAVAEPVLDGPGVVSGVCQRIAAAMPQHVDVHREAEASALSQSVLAAC